MSNTILSKKSKKILQLIAKGHGYQQILALHPLYTYVDIFDAAKEALYILGESTDKSDDFPADEKLQIIRLKYPNAYKPWTEHDEHILKSMYNGGAPTRAIASALKRKSGAIRSRLRKLGLLEE